MQRILIIEDEELMRQSLADLLKSSGYDAVTIDTMSSSNTLKSTSEDSSRNLQTPNLSGLIDDILRLQPDLILLDINLPGVNGELLLKTLRAKSSTPVIMVTSRNTEIDEVLSMSYGADDYITKPYSPQVLLLRIAAVLRRMDGVTGPIQYRNLSVDLTRGVIEHDSKRTFLTKNEMIILGHLLNHQGEIVTRDALMTDLWNNHEYINDNALTVNVSRVRAKLKFLGAGDAIETRKGLGYVLS